MGHDLENSIALLKRTPAALDTLLRDLPEPWTLRNEGENTWSVFDVVGHLIHGERTGVSIPGEGGAVEQIFGRAALRWA